MSVGELLRQAKALSPNERKELLNLLQELVELDLAEIDEQKPKRSLFELVGMGKGIWQGVDAQDYVNQLRDEWD
ncbi:MAG: hypothetical protein OXI40_16380 [Chloroflexota bacterium]|nr:hypothetical protein [Chloroflexota bacterium]